MHLLRSYLLANLIKTELSDLSFFLLLLFGLWVWEGWTRFPPGAWVFCKKWHDWRAESSTGYLRIGSWAWVWLPPSFLKSRVMLAQGLPISLGQEGVWLHASQTPNPGSPSQGEGQVIPWDELNRIIADKHYFLVDDRRQGEMQSSACPSKLLSEIQPFAKIKAKSRSIAFNAWAESHLDPLVVKKKLKKINLITRDLRIGLVVYTGWLFCAVPLMIISRGWSGAWPWVLCGTLGYQVSLTCLAKQVHARVLPHRSDERAAWVLACSLSPASLLRAVDQIAFLATADIHPVALAVALMDGKQRRDLLLRIARDLHFPCPSHTVEANQTAVSIDFEHRMRLINTLESIEPELISSVHAPPIEIESQSASAWCPRCHTVYIRESGICADCGVQLRSI